MSALRRVARAAYTCFWHGDTCVPEALLLARTALWWLLLLRSGDALFRARTLIQVISFSTKSFWVAWCGMGILLVLAGLLLTAFRPAAGRWLRGGGLLWLAGFWAGTFGVLHTISPGSLLLGDCAVSCLLAIWLVVRLSERHIPPRLRPWLRRHPRSLLTRVSAVTPDGGVGPWDRR